jgi:hypothetical protein
MNAAQSSLAACVLMAICLPFAPGQEASSAPQVKLTSLNRDQTISRHASYPITWTAANIPANTMLSLRIQWTDQVKTGGALRAVENNRLIGAVLDSASQKRFAALSRSAADLPTIESGKYLWDVDKFCQENKNGNTSVCQPAVHYRLQLILRSADDPCADNLHCAKPRSLFKVLLSDGEFTLRD